MLIGSGLILTHFISPHATAILVPRTVQVPHQVSVQKEQTLYTESNKIIPSGYYITFPPDGIFVESGKLIKLSWSADGNSYVYILTETQFEDFKWDGIASNWEAFSYGKEGTISANIQRNDKYYAVVSNSPLFGSPIKLYQAQAVLIWQETTTQYRNETEYVSKEVNDNLYFYSGILIFIIGLAVLIYRKLKPNFNLVIK